MFLFQDSDGGACAGRPGAEVELEGDTRVREGFLEVVVLRSIGLQGRLRELFLVSGQEHEVLRGKKMFEQGDAGRGSFRGVGASEGFVDQTEQRRGDSCCTVCCCCAESRLSFHSVW